MSSAEAAGVVKIAVKRMVRAYPFHAHLLSMALIEEEPDIETMAVTVRAGRVAFLFNASYLLTLGLDEIVGVLHHEVLHVVFGHVLAIPGTTPISALERLPRRSR